MKKFFILLIILLSVSCKNHQTENLEVPSSSSSALIESSISLSSSLEESISLSSSSIDNQDKVKIYLNPSVQANNLYASSCGSEASHMYELTLLIKEKLENYHFLTCYYNLDYLSLKESCTQSNSYNVDIHLALHSNAGGGKGSEIFAYQDDYFAQWIYQDYQNSAINLPARGVKYTSSLYELKNVHAPYTALFELFFHDNETECIYFCTNIELFASIVSLSLINFAYNLFLLRIE
jgi:N-acetylmuramoyl-L-alanine amidase